MEIRNIGETKKEPWNRFVEEHYPPVGAFMQTWEWGTFQEALGRKIERYFLGSADKPEAAFTLVHRSPASWFSYGYIPRGPVIAEQNRGGDARATELFKLIGSWARQKFPHLAFLRMEPPLASFVSNPRAHGLFTPSYYIQPRYNLAVSLEGNVADIPATFHPTTRSNLHRAEKRGVTVELKTDLTEGEFKEFLGMVRDTIDRNDGKKIYPSPSYFRSLIETTAKNAEADSPHNLSLGIFYGYQNGEPAAANFVLFFGNTATYLYGASHTKHLSSKVTTYLHWVAMQEAKKRGFCFYDLGGIDDVRWPTLTDFKRQFGGTEFRYIGNIDVPIRPLLHRGYNFLRALKQ